MRSGLLILGVICIALGGLWTLQGIGMVGGSFMTGQSQWAMIGGILLLIGLLLCAYAARRPASPR